MPPPLPRVLRVPLLLLLLVVAVAVAAAPSSPAAAPKVLASWLAASGKPRLPGTPLPPNRAVVLVLTVLDAPPALLLGVGNVTLVGSTLGVEWNALKLLRRGNGTMFVSGTVMVPPVEGMHTLQFANPARTLKLSTTVEVSCSDGVVCNGVERLSLVGGRQVCVSAPRKLCDDGQACTQDMCSYNGQCSHSKITPPESIKGGSTKPDTCQECRNSGCRPTCGLVSPRRECGFDGCFGACGTCAAGQTCVSGYCHHDDGRFGTCTNPLSITAQAVGIGYSGVITVQANMTTALDALTPRCQSWYSDPELVFRIDLPASKSYTGLSVQVDVSDVLEYSITTVTIIEVDRRQYPTPSLGCLASTLRPEMVWACASSQVMQGDRVSEMATWMMKPNFTYFVTLEVHDPIELSLSGAAQTSPGLLLEEAAPGGRRRRASSDGFTQNPIVPLKFTLTPECTMDCMDSLSNTKECGSSACPGFECGKCVADEKCVSGYCYGKNECIPNCANKQCGMDDGCGWMCCFSRNAATALGPSTTAAPDTKQAKRSAKLAKIQARPDIPACVPTLPVCYKVNKDNILESGCKQGKYCASNCTCLPMNAKLPDLTLQEFQPELVEDYWADGKTCAFAEGCLAGVGMRRVIRFDTSITNQGTAPFDLPSPPTKFPALFEWAPCHGHYHLKNMLKYTLLDANGTVHVEGQKRSFCIMDSEAIVKAPNVPCRMYHTCGGRQGLNVGWMDIYSKDLDCQFLDVTDVAPGFYMVRQCVNLNRVFVEASFENNCVEAWINIPVPPTDAPSATRSPTHRPGTGKGKGKGKGKGR